MEYSTRAAANMSRIEEIHELLSAKFAGPVIQVDNDSDHHAVAPGSESHLRVVVVSKLFEGLPLLARHRMVYETLAEYLQTTVHALALHTFTETEWGKKMQPAPESPACLGGGKIRTAK